jgi:hypothetical protein
MKDIQERVEEALFNASTTLQEYRDKLEKESITGDGYGHLSVDNDLLRVQYQSEMMVDLLERFGEDLKKVAWQWS